MKSTCGVALVCVIAVLAGSAAARPTSATFAVTLRATVTKDWISVSETTEQGCGVSHRWVGKRRIVLRSARPTTVVVAAGRGRASFRPSAVRSVLVDVTTTGAVLTHVKAPCGERIETKGCRRYHHVVRGATFRFFRSRWNEISFHPARLPVERRSCPRESAGVRAIRPGLEDAEAAISEVDLAGGASQTGFASAEVTTRLEGTETGRVVERVRWSLTFTRR